MVWCGFLVFFVVVFVFVVFGLFGACVVGLGLGCVFLL